MNDEAEVAAPAPAPQARRSFGRWLVALVVILVLAGLGYGGWSGWQWYQQTLQGQRHQRAAQQKDMQALQARTVRMDEQLASLEGDAQAAQQRAAGLKAHVDTLQQQLAALSKRVEGGARTAQLQVVEQLLLLANEQAQIAHDPRAAGVALAAADAQLAALNDPRFFAVRQALTTERSALAAVREPDLDGVAIELGQLIAAVPSLPFRGTQFTLPASAPPPPRMASGWQRAWAQVVDGLRSLFVVRHHQQPVQPMLSDAEQGLVSTVLVVRLDAARAALPARNTRLYRDELEAARAWLARWYQRDAPTVQAADAQITALVKMELAPALPALGSGLSLLRAQQSASQ
ncbi:MAG TPA: uroporphyrinogen-III C-methyltransferase [Nevskiaceae bacterium]